MRSLGFVLYTIVWIPFVSDSPAAGFQKTFDSCPDLDSPIVSKLGTNNSASDLHMKEMWFYVSPSFVVFSLFPPPSLQCAALVGEDQPLCPDLPELDLSELDVSDLDADSFLGGLKWYSDQSEIISTQYGNDASNLFEVSTAYSRFLLSVCIFNLIPLITLLFLSIIVLWNIFASTDALPGVRRELE